MQNSKMGPDDAETAQDLLALIASVCFGVHFHSGAGRAMSQPGGGFCSVHRRAAVTAAGLSSDRRRERFLVIFLERA